MGTVLSPSDFAAGTPLSPSDSRADRDLKKLLAFLNEADLPGLDRYLRQTLGTDLAGLVESALKGGKAVPGA